MSVIFEDLLIDTEALPSSGLSWPGASDAELSFMRQVYDINVTRSSRRGTFLGDLPNDQLGTIEGGYKALKPAANACIDLLDMARASIVRDGVNVKVGVASGYRSASHQFQLWQNYFPQYFRDTATQRASMDGGPLGNKAAEWMAGFVGGRVATPGFSNHQNGIAIDFSNTENGSALRNSTKPAALKAWKQTWFWRWLLGNGAAFGFYQNLKIDEPWHWEYKGINAKEDLESGSFTYEEDLTETIPPLIKPDRQSDPPLETIYAKIDLGLGKEWGDSARTERYTVEPKTGIFLPQHFSAVAPADLLIFLHGYKSAALGKDKSVDKWWDIKRFPHYALRELINQTGCNLILAVPTLGPRSQPGNLTTAAGFENFVDQVISAVNQHCSASLNGNTFSVRNIIVACHSGGGAPMARISKLTGNAGTHADRITAFWGFDSLYGGQDADTWLAWGKSNPHRSVYQFYIPNTKTAKQGEELAGKIGATPQNVFATPSVEKRHEWVPHHYLKERLADCGKTADQETEEHHEGCGCGCQEDADDYAGEATVTFPSGQTLSIVSGPDQPGEEYYDPNNSGNPLLDTSGANRQIMLSANIQVSEIAKSGGNEFDKARIDVELIKCLQAIRDKAGKAITINSGYRSYAYNMNRRKQSSNVALKSQHMSGRAADVRIAGMTGIQIGKLALDSYGCNIGVGLAPDFAHIDVRGQFAVWRYAGDPGDMDKKVREIREYQKSCSAKPAPALTGDDPKTQDAIKQILSILRNGFWDKLPETNEAIAEARVTQTSELHTSWTKDFELILKRDFNNGPRNLSRQNDFNDALLSAQNEWDQLDPFILKSLLAQESGFNVNAVNSLGFAGIAQLGMEEAKSVGLSTGASKEQTSNHRTRKETYPKDYFDFSGDERFNATKSILGAARLLKKKWQSLNRSVFPVWGYPEGDDLHKFVLGAYNAGEGNVKRRVDRVYGPVCLDRIRFDEMGTGAWINYANIIAGRARQ